MPWAGRSCGASRWAHCGDSRKPAEKSALPLRADAPVHGRRLIPLLHPLPFARIVKPAPRSMSHSGGRKVVVRQIEVLVIVLVENNRHGMVARRCPGLPHHLRDAGRVLYPMAMQQQEVGDPHHFFVRHRPASVTGAHQQPAAVLPGPARPLNQFMHPVNPGAIHAALRTIRNIHPLWSDRKKTLVHLLTPWQTMIDPVVGFRCVYFSGFWINGRWP